MTTKKMTIPEMWQAPYEDLCEQMARPTETWQGLAQAILNARAIADANRQTMKATWVLVIATWVMAAATWVLAIVAAVD